MTEQYMASPDHDNLTKRISIRFTARELERLEAMAAAMHERKVSSMLRRIYLSWEMGTARTADAER